MLYYDEEELFKEREVDVPENPVTIVTKDNAIFSTNPNTTMKNTFFQ